MLKAIDDRCSWEEDNLSSSQSQGGVQRILEVGVEHGYIESDGGGWVQGGIFQGTAKTKLIQRCSGIKGE